MARSVHTITIPSATRYLEDVRRFVAKHANGASFPAETVHALQLAVDEACANVIEHAYRGEESNTIDVDVVIKSDRLTVRIRDEGRPFVDAEYREPDIFEYASRKKSGGFGVHLMRKLADQVEYSTRGKSNVCSLTMYRLKQKRSSSTKKGATRKSAAKKPAAKKPAARKSNTKKAATKKPATKKATVKKATVKKAARKKAAGKKTPTKKAAKRTPARTASKKSTRKKSEDESRARKAPGKSRGS